MTRVTLLVRAREGRKGKRREERKEGRRKRRERGAQRGGRRERWRNLVFTKPI